MLHEKSGAVMWPAERGERWREKPGSVLMGLPSSWPIMNRSDTNV